MRFSVTTGAAGPGLDPAGLAELAALAEDAGWDAFLLEDYLVYQGQVDTPTYDPWISLAAMATTTRRIRLGTTVTPLPRRRPWKLASEAVSLDHLSGAILGVGSGDAGDPGVAAVGEATEPRVLAERLDEGLAILAGLWSGQEVHHEGAHYRVDGLRLAATPVQRPRIPIWVGGNLLVPSVRRRIARWDGCCAYKRLANGVGVAITPEDVRGILALVAQERGTAEGFDVKVSGTDDPAEIAGLAEAGATWWGRWIEPGDPGRVREIIVSGPPRV
ncbi:LLM class flavin-dependent oxidoreductase [Actinopolymorpha pittospori]|uniref:Luciferase-like domain-containing protein n=1 Tax=Actinopolymorpha pittospori TaxID=648752 RepID=A0A927MV66_9ACTN|nr:LLM class flavin-dependent oxidoreductase [Actinopolymorpha pittospori]MBE1607476.1 hypothetical protein [Actinopolymorpha pittospori]